MIKSVVNDNGGTSLPGAFTVHVKSGGNDVAGSPAAGVAGPGGRDYTLAPGTHVVSEDAPPAGFAQTSIVCDGVATDTVTVRRGATNLHDHERRHRGEADRDQEHRQRRGRHEDGGRLHAHGDGQRAEPGELRRRGLAWHAGVDSAGVLQRLRVRGRRLHRLALERLLGSIALGETKTATVVTNTDDDTPSSIQVTKTATPTSLTRAAT